MATPPPPAHALRVRDLRLSYAAPDGGRLDVLDLPHLEVACGTSLAVLGESGSGKTSLLHVIAGLLPATSGLVEVMGEVVTGRTEARRDRLRARHIGYVYQSLNLLPHLTAQENVALGLTFSDEAVGPAVGARARAALERVGLGERLDHRPAQLSVGQRQRVAIARALAGRPGLVLADEPTAHLDPRHAQQGLDLLLAFAAECGAAVLVVTHDAAVLARIPDHLELRSTGATETV